MRIKLRRLVCLGLIVCVAISFLPFTFRGDDDDDGDDDYDDDETRENAIQRHLRREREMLASQLRHKQQLLAKGAKKVGGMLRGTRKKKEAHRGDDDDASAGSVHDDPGNPNGDDDDDDEDDGPEDDKVALFWNHDAFEKERVPARAFHLGGGAPLDDDDEDDLRRIREGREDRRFVAEPSVPVDPGEDLARKARWAKTLEAQGRWGGAYLGNGVLSPAALAKQARALFEKRCRREDSD